LSWRVSNALDTGFCLEAVHEAIDHYGTPEIFNTDQDSQFTSLTFTDLLKVDGIRISMNGKESWRGNAFIEQLWRTIKYEEVHLKAYESVYQARASLGRYFEFYNTGRPPFTT
jgi:putative transposase